MPIMPFIIIGFIIGGMVGIEFIGMPIPFIIMGFIGMFIMLIIGFIGMFIMLIIGFIGMLIMPFGGICIAGIIVGSSFLVLGVSQGVF